MKPEILFGHCHCGCGQKTNLAGQSLTKTGTVKGQPNRYIKGHQTRNSELFVKTSEACIATGIERNLHLAYLNGVIHGDGYLTNVLGLRVSDKDFAEAFAVAASAVSGRLITPQHQADYRRQFNSVCNWKYWEARSGNRNGAFECVREFVPVTETELAAWLRGMFDSEGNATCHKIRHGTESYGRAIEFFNCNTDTIARLVKFLEQIGIPSRPRPMKNGKGHLGTKQVYRVTLKSSIENFTRFRDLVGSNIKRKRETIEKMISTYHPDIRAHCRDIQLKGAATRTRRMLEVNLPRIVQAIADRMATGKPVTIEACAKHIHGYYGVLGRHFTQSQLREKAKELLCKKSKSA